jgi:uncharacterized protein (DUF924 family)
MTHDPAAILAAWASAGRKAWYRKNQAFDDSLRRFEAEHHAAARRELDGWEVSSQGALALLILLDQIPRNLWRGSAHAFATDPLARSIAKRAIAAGHDIKGDALLRPFFYMPLQHSEDMADQDRSISLFETLPRQAADPDWRKSAHAHRDIIQRFGRFPHRNRALGRETTPQEQAFLDAGGFAG